MNMKNQQLTVGKVWITWYTCNSSPSGEGWRELKKKIEEIMVEKLSTHRSKKFTEIKLKKYEETHGNQIAQSQW